MKLLKTTGQKITLIIVKVSLGYTLLSYTISGNPYFVVSAGYWGMALALIVYAIMTYIENKK